MSYSGDGLLPATGYGPGTIIIAVIGGVLTAGGWLLSKVGLRKVTR